jgi:copper oxidase (laccase) domain-containing protein
MMNEDPILSPVYKVFSQYKNVGAAYTGKGTSPLNNYFSFQRPSASNPPGVSENFFNLNLTELANRESFDPARVVLPKRWLHSGEAIKAEDHHYFHHTPSTDELIPVTASNQAITYDGIVTASKEYVLAVQGADCPAIFLYDPKASVIGLAHAGWKPVVRGIIQNTINVMKRSGAKPQDILAYVSPGAGDKYNEFLWDQEMEPHVRDVFIEAGKQDLLEDRTVRHEMSDQDKFDLASVLGREVQGGISFKISELAVTLLGQCGVPHDNIILSHDSSIVKRNPGSGGSDPASFRYHSFRRERPDHGLSMSIMFLKAEPKTQLQHP